MSTTRANILEFMRQYSLAVQASVSVSNSPQAAVVGFIVTDDFEVEELLVAVRGTGHNVAGFAVCDNGLVIDLSHMKGITVDPLRLTVRAEGGCNWGEVNDALQPHGLAATGGFVSVTGVSGLTLGGGLGWLVRKHGLALDNLGRRGRWAQGGVRCEARAPRGAEGEVRPDELVPDEPKRHACPGRRRGCGGRLTDFPRHRP
jgi:hypothetical protein